MLNELWQQEKDRLAEILYQRVTNGNENIRPEEVFGQGYPEYFEAFAKRLAHKLFHDESPVKLQEDSRYDLEDPTIKSQLARLEEYLTLRSCFTENEIRQLANQAVDFQHDVLVRPRQALLEKLFDDAEQHRVEDVLVILHGFGEDRPYIQRLILEIEQVESDILPQIEFVDLAKQTEKEIYRTAPISAFMKEIQLLLNFEGEVTGEPHFVIRSPVLIGLLRERSLDAIADSLKQEANDKEFWTPDEIENALDRFILVGSLGDEPPGPSPIDDDLDLVAGEQEVLDFRLPETVSFDEVEAIKPRADQPETVDNDEVLHIQFGDEGNEEEELADDEVTVVEQKPDEYPALTTLIDTKSRKAIIKKIFHKDDFEYVEFIQRLDRIDKWSDAKIVIDEELAKRNVAPQSKEAVLLGDVVFSRYFPKNND